MEIFPLIFVSYLMTNFTEIKAFYNDTLAQAPKRLKDYWTHVSYNRVKCSSSCFTSVARCSVRFCYSIKEFSRILRTRLIILSNFLIDFKKFPKLLVVWRWFDIFWQLSKRFFSPCCRNVVFWYHFWQFCLLVSNDVNVHSPGDYNEAIS